MIDMKNISCKFWITQFISAKYSDNKNIISSIIPKIYKCDAKMLCLDNQIFSYNDFAFLVSNAEDINFKAVTVMNENDLIVPFEKVFEAIPKIKYIYYDTNLSNITPKTVKKLLKLPNFLQIEMFHLINIPETFDIETFYNYMKKNKNTHFQLDFGILISEAYENRLEEIIDELIEAENQDYKIPLILFFGLDLEKCCNLDTIFRNSFLMG
uniref:Uncharacterized protein n=1 Tax=Panagrolaimus davidi TaxID=227884 RepID=A0A914QHM0_9BILA